MEIHGGEDHQHEESLWSFSKYLNRHSDWLEETRGNIMVAATLIASMSFQVMANPPGGVWQSDNFSPTSNGTTSVCIERAGTAVLACEISKRRPYLIMIVSSTVSFSASMSIILLAISGLRLRNRMIMAILISFMLVAVLCISLAFLVAVVLVHSNDHDIDFILQIYLAFWFLFPGLILVIQLIRFLVRLICFICRCCGRRKTVHSTVAATGSVSGPLRL